MPARHARSRLSSLKSSASTLILSLTASLLVIVGPGLVTPAAAAYSEIELLASADQPNKNAETTDMLFLAERSQRKTLTKAGVGPFTMTHNNANDALDYSFITDADYGRTSGSGHSSCTVTTSETNSRTCLAQLKESDVRSNSSVVFSVPSLTTYSATLNLSGTINSQPRGGSGSNTKDGFVTFGSIFGPEVWSKPFSAVAGQKVSFEWTAAGSSDDYEIYGFLVAVSDPGVCSNSTDFGGSTQAEKEASHTIIAYGRGKYTINSANSSIYLTSAGSVASDGCYRFRLVGGTYDASGGYAVGSTFAIKNLRLGSSQTLTVDPVNDLVLDSSPRTIPITASSNVGGATLTYTLMASQNSVCSLNSGAATITVAANRSGYCLVAIDSAAVGNASAAATTYLGFTVLAAATAPNYSGGAALTGNATICSTLTASDGSWADGGSTITSTTYQWYRDGAAITGETSSTYQVQDADLGSAIYFTVTKTNAEGSTTGTADPSTIVDARLTGLSFSGGSLSPAFAGCQASYTVTTVESTVSVVATMNNDADSVQVSGSAVASGQSSAPLTLLPGSNTIPIVVTNGDFTQTTNIVVNYAAPPTLELLAPTFTDGTVATLSANINANGYATSDISFTVSPTGGTGGTPALGTLSPSQATGNSSTAVEQALTGLISGGTYELILTATNTNGTTTATLSFQTPDAPSVTTGAASNIGPTSASISYVINTYNRDTAVTLSYGVASDLSDASDLGLGTITGDLNATSGTADVSGLSVGQTYYYRLSAQNSAGSNDGVIRSFTTLGAPSVSPATAAGGERQATLRATVNPGGQATTNVRFYYGTDNTFAASTSVAATPSTLYGSSDVEVVAGLTNLAAGTYYFKIEATNASGTALSTDYGEVTVIDSLPSVTLSAPASVATGGSITVIIRFSETVTGFSSGDLGFTGVSGYAAAGAQDLGSGAYSVQLTTAGSNTGTMTISLASGKADEATGDNRGNLAAASITVQVGIPNPDLSLSTTSYSFTVGVAISAITPVNSGGAASSWSVTPTLVSGLSLNSTTGVISGTPSATQSAANFTITAENAEGGTDTLTIEIAVLELAPNISYAASAFTFVATRVATTVSPTNAGGSASSWSITPALPSGLNFNTSSGEITGTPVSSTASATFTITAQNTGGTASIVISIEVASVPVAQTPSSPAAPVLPVISSIFPKRITAPPTDVTLSGRRLNMVVQVVIDGVRYDVSGNAASVTFTVGQHSNGFKSIFLIGPGIGTYEYSRALEFEVSASESSTATGAGASASKTISVGNGFEIQRAGSELIVANPSHSGQVRVYEDGRLIAATVFDTSNSALVIDERVTGEIVIKTSDDEVMVPNEVRDFLWYENWSLGSVSPNGLSEWQNSRIQRLLKGDRPSGSAWEKRASGGPVTKFICTGTYKVGASNAEIAAAKMSADQACSKALLGAPSSSQVSFFSQTRATATDFVGKVLATVKGFTDNLLQMMSAN